MNHNLHFHTFFHIPVDIHTLSKILIGLVFVTISVAINIIKFVDISSIELSSLFVRLHYFYQHLNQHRNLFAYIQVVLIVQI